MISRWLRALRLWWAERAVDKPWTAEASGKIDRFLTDREKRR